MNDIRDRYRQDGKKDEIGAVGGTVYQQQIANHPNEELNEDVLEQEVAAVELLRSIKSRVKAENWDMFVRCKFLREDATTVAKEYGIKRASVYQNLSRITKMIRTECEALDSDNSSATH